MLLRTTQRHLPLSKDCCAAKCHMNVYIEVRNWLTEMLRSLADMLGFKARLVVIDFAKECNPELYNLIRSKLPAAHFATVGGCRADKRIDISLEAMLKQAVQSRAYATEGAYMLLPFVDTRKFPQSHYVEVCNYIRSLADQQYRPLLLNYFPQQFMRDIRSYNLSDDYLYYDNLVILSTGKQSRDGYAEMLDKVSADVLPDEYFYEPMLETNARLGATPLIPMFKSSASQYSANNSQLLLNSCAAVTIMYGIYKQLKKCSRTGKHKPR